jgi:2-methylisocitrate lyase-like PEP mutase family enzyme
MSAQARIVARFRALHGGPELLVLANAWDVLSARLVEETGGKAVATTSAGIAWALGYADGERLPVERLSSVARDLVRAVELPVSIDLERGYSEEPARVAELVRELASLGVAGVNLEDGGGAPEVFAAKLAACRECLTASGLDSFLNARADVLLHGSGSVAERAADAVRRGLIYRAAGADGFFVPGWFESKYVEQIAAAVPLPLNVWSSPERAGFFDLAKLGVRRVSVGPRIALNAYSIAKNEMSALHRQAPRADSAPLTYPEVNGWLSRMAR